MVQPDCPKCSIASETLKGVQRQLEREQAKIRLNPDQALRMIRYLKILHEQEPDAEIRLLARVIHHEIPKLARLKGNQWFDKP